MLMTAWLKLRLELAELAAKTVGVTFWGAEVTLCGCYIDVVLMRLESWLQKTVGVTI